MDYRELIGHDVLPDTTVPAEDVEDDVPYVQRALRKLHTIDRYIVTLSKMMPLKGKPWLIRSVCP